MHRYASAQQMAGDLQRFLDDRPIAARRAGSAERLMRWCRRNKVIATLTAAVGLSLVGGIIASSYFAWKSNGRYRQALASAREADKAAPGTARTRLYFRPAEDSGVMGKNPLRPG